MREDEGKVEGLGEPLPEDVIEAVPSVVMKAVDDWIRRQRLLGNTRMMIDDSREAAMQVAGLVEAIEEALEAAEKNAAVEAHPIRKLCDKIAAGADDGIVIGVAIATVGADKQTGQLFHCPTDQNVMSGAIGQLQWTYHMSRHMDMLSQQQASGRIVRPGR